jgi:hypothetical protein
MKYEQGGRGHGPGTCGRDGCEEPREEFPSGWHSGYCRAHRQEATRGAHARRRVRLWAEFLAEYGGQCHCCGLDDPRFLSVGHTFGDGATARRNLGGKGAHVLYDLRRRGWPKDEGIATECFNCNLGSARNGGTCPHKDA